MKTAAVLWTGGKDSMLALLAVRRRLRVRCLATFTPDPPHPFLAHPLESMVAQSASLGMEHRVLPVRPPLEAAYEAAIDTLAAEGIEVLVTGDMDRVDGHESWIVERSRGRVEVERPLWGADRRATLRSVVELGLRVVCTLSRDDSFDPPIAGRELDGDLVEELVRRQGVSGFDACGENGEYHTCVLDGPGFARPLELAGARVVAAPGFHHLAFDGVRRVGS